MIAVQGPKAVGAVPGMFDADAAQLKYYYADADAVPRQGVRRQPHRLHRRGRLRDHGRRTTQAVTLWDELVGRGARCRAGSGRATRCGSKPRCRSTATS